MDGILSGLRFIREVKVREWGCFVRGVAGGDWAVAEVGCGVLFPRCSRQPIVSKCTADN